MLRQFLILNKEYGTEYFVLTDERQAIIFNKFKWRFHETLSVSRTHVHLSEQISLRCILGAALNQSRPDYYYRPRVRFQPVLGSLNRNDAITSNDNPAGFSDFDLYTMQRHFSHFRSFISWKTGAHRAALARPLRLNDSLDVHVDAFLQREHLLRFILPLEKTPQETLDLLMKYPRPRQSEVDDILTHARERKGTLRFRITKTSRSRNTAFSVIAFGKLEWFISESDASAETPAPRLQTEADVCLKLFDETLFPLPSLEECEDDFRLSEPEERLSGVNYAVDMMRQEMAVYERLQYLQGTLLPHNYGFHEVGASTHLLHNHTHVVFHLQFILPGDGRKLYGFFMETIHGFPLSAVDLTKWPKDVQLRMVYILHVALRTQSVSSPVNLQVHRVRHAVRALGYSGIKQVDWNGGQILVTKFPPVAPTADVTDSDIDFVLIDFAFTNLRLGSMLYGNYVAELFSDSSDCAFLEMFDTVGGGFRHDDETWFPFDDYEQ